MKNKYSISSILCDRSSTSTILSRVSIKYLNSYIQELASMAPLLVPRLLFTILFIIKGSLLLNLI